jgi:hypothetical protein
MSWVSAGPGHIGSRAVSGGNVLVHQPEVERQLRPMMGGVEHATPEDPDALAGHVEKGVFGQPPFLWAAGEKIQAPAGEGAHPLAAGMHGEGGRQEAIGVGLGRL